MDGRIRIPFSRCRGGLANSLLKNAVMAFFNLAKRESKASRRSQNTDLRRHFVITSM
jgi:hypothetical protein